MASLTKRKGWLRTTERAETRNGMSYLSGSFQLSSCPHPAASSPIAHAIFVPRCKSFYKVFIPILFPKLPTNHIFFLSLSPSAHHPLPNIVDVCETLTLTNFRCLEYFYAEVVFVVFLPVFCLFFLVRRQERSGEDN